MLQVSMIEFAQAFRTTQALVIYYFSANNQYSRLNFRVNLQYKHLPPHQIIFLHPISPPSISSWLASLPILFSARELEAVLSGILGAC